MKVWYLTPELYSTKELGEIDWNMDSEASSLENQAVL